MSLTPRKKKKGKRGTIMVGPIEGRDLRLVASEALYVGSPEHKAYVNPVLGEAPHPRSDKSQCEKFPAAMWCQFTRLLRIAIEMGCIGDQMDVGGWPRYVWGWFDGQMFEARHRTDPPGNRYKGWILEPDEYPEDLSGRLITLRERLERDDV